MSIVSIAKTNLTKTTSTVKAMFPIIGTHILNPLTLKIVNVTLGTKWALSMKMSANLLSYSQHLELKHTSGAGYWNYEASTYEEPHRIWF